MISAIAFIPFDILESIRSTVVYCAYGYLNLLLNSIEGALVITWCLTISLFFFLWRFVIRYYYKKRASGFKSKIFIRQFFTFEINTYSQAYLVLKVKNNSYKFDRYIYPPLLVELFYTVFSFEKEMLRIAPRSYIEFHFSVKSYDFLKMDSKSFFFVFKDSAGKLFYSEKTTVKKLDKTFECYKSQLAITDILLSCGNPYNSNP